MKYKIWEYVYTFKFVKSDSKKIIKAKITQSWIAKDERWCYWKKWKDYEMYTLEEWDFCQNRSEFMIMKYFTK